MEISPDETSPASSSFRKARLNWQPSCKSKLSVAYGRTVHSLTQPFRFLPPFRREVVVLRYWLSRHIDIASENHHRSFKSSIWIAPLTLLFYRCSLVLQPHRFMLQETHERSCPAIKKQCFRGNIPASSIHVSCIRITLEVC
jgi:hypothetical protein